MLRPILILNLPESATRKLQSMGFDYVEDLENVLNTPKKVSPQLKSIIIEYKILEKIIHSRTPRKVISGAGLWHREFQDSHIAVFHRGLDKLLHGGLPFGKITELCGPPGCGKTQLCLQFCVDALTPSCFGGSAAETLYISTDFGFGVERLSEMLEASIQHFNTHWPDSENKNTAFEHLNVKTLLNSIHVLQIYDLNDVTKAVKNLNAFLEANQRVRLIIIDSFSLPLVTGVEDLLSRSKIIAEMMDILLDNAMKFKLAVVLTNQLVTVLTQKNKSILKPALGEGFGHRLHQRLLLVDGKIYLTKSIRRSQEFIEFNITKEGIR